GSCVQIRERTVPKISGCELFHLLKSYLHSYSNIGNIETKHTEKDEYFNRATNFYNKASKIDKHEPSTWVGKGQLLLEKGDHEQAYGAYKITLDGQLENIPMLLGQAC
ncbi:hypothetical protein KI387_024971, partial [Taxus chinensis]